MLKILVWRVSDDERFLQDTMNILERQHNGLEVVGVTADESIKLAEVDAGNYDVLLVVGAKEIGMSKIVQAARQLNLPEEKLLGDWIVCIPGFSLDKYRQLQSLRLSILSKNCFGGVISHTLGLPFRSPFVNLWLHGKDFVKFLRAPYDYLKETPRFEKFTSKSQAPGLYPLFSLGDLSLNMMHYKTAEEALTKWNERKPRINPQKLFVVASTDDKEVLRDFDALPYDKKVCFVPFKSDLDSAWYINYELSGRKYFWQTIKNFAKGNPFYYDPFDMLLYGKKTPLIDM